MKNTYRLIAAAVVQFVWTAPLDAESPFATRLVEFSPAPGQFVNDPLYNDPQDALGPPEGFGLSNGNNVSVVSLGGFGGYIVLGFDDTILDDPRNPFGLDAIVFGNAFYVGNASRHWAECATIEISLDVNGNALADDAWYLIPGSHIDDPPLAWTGRTWDSNVIDATYPPSEASWIPPGRFGMWSSAAYALPVDPFGNNVVINPGGASHEAIWGYADYSPTLPLGDTPAEQFYTFPDDPFTAGITFGSGGGDAFDIAWAIDSISGKSSSLPGFDFIRLTTAVESLLFEVNEKSAEIDAVADVSPDPFGDMDTDGDVDLYDAAEFQVCFDAGAGGGNGACAAVDRQPDARVDLDDAEAFAAFVTGPLQ